MDFQIDDLLCGYLLNITNKDDKEKPNRYFVFSKNKEKICELVKNKKIMNIDELNALSEHVMILDLDELTTEKKCIYCLDDFICTNFYEHNINRNCINCDNIHNIKDFVTNRINNIDDFDIHCFEDFILYINKIDDANNIFVFFIKYLEYKIKDIITPSENTKKIRMEENKDSFMPIESHIYFDNKNPLQFHNLTTL